MSEDTQIDVSSLKVAELRAELSKSGLKTSGLKAELLKRLQAHIDEQEQKPVTESNDATEETPATENRKRNEPDEHGEAPEENEGPAAKKLKSDEETIPVQHEEEADQPVPSISAPAHGTPSAAEETSAGERAATDASNSKIKHILLDIEGTTTSISFVHDVLFPFASEHLEDFLKRKSTPEVTDHEVQDAVEAIRAQAEDDLKAAGNPFEAVAVPQEPQNEVLKAVIENVHQSMKRDRKVTGLKKLQGLIWQEGYHSGQLKSQVYKDAVRALKRWTSGSLPFKVHIYSSGSVAAQKMLFKWTADGDLTKYLDSYFDTTSGLKVEANSYRTIATKLDVQPNEILFLTDNVKEAKACLEAGVATLIAHRPDNAPLSDEDRKVAPVITSFAEVDSHLV